MQFLKSHWISLVCGLVGAGAIAMAVLGMTSEAVVEKMKKRVSSASKINSLKSDPKNETIIAAEKARGEAFDREYEKTREEAERINRREPLLAGVFPEPEKLSKRVDFQAAYSRAIGQFANELLGGDLPNDLEVQEEQHNVEELLELEREQAEEGGETAPAIQSRQPPSPRGGFSRTAPGLAGPRGGRVAPGLTGGGRGMGGAPSAAPATRSGDPKYDAVFRAYVSKAQSIRCYVGPGSFHVSPIVEETRAPRPADMWFAQVGLWIQQDVVTAIASLNNEAAQQADDTDAHVEQMPVKRIEHIEVQGYQTSDGLIPFPAHTSMGSRPGGGIQAASFTGRMSDEQFDVVRFNLAVIVDQRDLLQLIDRLTKQNFYQCIGAEYTQVPEEAGYMYGTEPVIRAGLAFEGYMACGVYRELMPPEVVQALTGQKQP